MKQGAKSIYFINLSCCGGFSSIASGDLKKEVILRAGVIIGQDSDLHLWEKQKQEGSSPKKQEELQLGNSMESKGDLRVAGKQAGLSDGTGGGLEGPALCL